MASTMSLDFMLFDKPVVNVAFGNEKNGLFDDQIFFNYLHYQYVLDSGAVIPATDKETLFNALDESLSYPEKRKNQRKELLDLEIGKPLEGTSKRIVNVLNSI